MARQPLPISFRDAEATWRTSCLLHIAWVQRFDNLRSQCGASTAAQKLAKWLSNADQAGAPAAVIELAPSMLQNHVTSGVEFDLLVVTGLRPSQLRGAQSLKNFKQSLKKL